MFKGASDKVKNQFADERTKCQMLITEDGRLVDQSLPIPVQAGSCEDKEARKAWLLDFRNTVIDRTEPSKPKFYQVVTERDVSPLILWEDTGRKFSQEEMDKIACNATETAIVLAEKRSDTKMLWWVILSTIAVLGIMLLARVALVNYTQYFGMAGGMMAGVFKKREKTKVTKREKTKVTPAKEEAKPEATSDTPPKAPVAPDEPPAAPKPVILATTVKKKAWWKFWSKAPEGEKPPEPNTMVLDQIKGRVYEYVEKPQGSLFRTTNQPEATRYPFVYLMKRDRDGVMSKVEPSMTLKRLPEDLYDALHDDVTGKWIAAGISSQEKLSLGICIFLAAVLALLNVIFYGRN